MQKRPSGGWLVGAGLAILAIASVGVQPALAQGSFGTWPSLESCEPWVRPESRASDEEGTRRASALIDRLRDPASSYELAFRSRLARGGAIFADGEQLDVDVPVITADFVGNALVHRPDHLAFLALADGPWSLAELRRDGERHTRVAPVQSWQAGATEGTSGQRLPDVLANAVAATPVAAPPGQDGHWYALKVSAGMGPGTMWDNTTDLFPVLRDADAELLVEAAEDGTPISACLRQGWWQGYDDVLGEEATMLSAIHFTRAGSAPPLPSVSPPGERQRAPGLDLEVPVPDGGETNWDGDVFWAWLDSEDELPRLRATRSLFTDEVLDYLRELPPEQALELMAQNDAASAKAGWDRDPSTNEPARIGGSDGEAPIPARLLTFHPDVDGLGTVLAIDVVAFADPWSYHFQFLAPTDDELAARYLLERTLEDMRFVCSPDGGDACPAETD